MKTVRLLTAFTFLFTWSQGLAQDLVISNARIIDGAGQTIEEGSIVITDGHISLISPDTVDAGDTAVIDAQGMTVLPGLIDVHRHDLLGSLRGFAELASDAEVAEAVEHKAPASMQALLAEGFTTVMMPGMFLSAGTEVRRRIERGEMAGPRLLFAGPGFTAPDDFPARGMVCGDNVYCSDHVAYQVTDPAVARAHVRSLAEAGVDAIKVFVDAEGTDLDDKVFAAVAAEAAAQGLATCLHAHRVEDMLDGVRLGADRLVHTPSDTLIAGGPGARLLRERGVAIATTASYTAPAFAEAAGFPYSAAVRRERLLQNIRHLMDEGVVVAFGTDSPDLIRPMVEIEELSRVLAPEEVIATLTRNAALFLEREDEIGTIEPGKVADLVIVNGNPVTNIHDLAHLQLVIQEGVVTVDNRQ
jgi:imidazolonepropionase-like amidohydrolase